MVAMLAYGVMHFRARSFKERIAAQEALRSSRRAADASMRGAGDTISRHEAILALASIERIDRHRHAAE
jgi:hypothetical protein